MTDVGQALALRDIHLPAPPGVWPPAPGWWLLALLLLATTGFAIWVMRRGWRRHQRRQRVLMVLAQLPAEGCSSELIAGVSGLLKRAALERFPREEVAALRGEAWLAFLDRTGGGGRFMHGAGRVLADGPYAPAPQCDAEALRRLARAWLRRNL